MTHKKTDEGYPIFRSYLEEENDKPYYSMNTLSFYYEDMERKQELIETLAKKIVGYDLTLTDNLETIQREVEQRINAWDNQVEQLPDTVNDLLTDWVTDGTIDTIIEDARLNLKVDKTEMENRLELVDQQLADKADDNEVRKLSVPIGLNDASSDLIAAIEGGEGATFNLLSEPRKKSVTHEKTTFIVTGKNLFDKSKAVNGKTLSSGVPIDYAGYAISDFISITPNEVYKASKTMNVHFYNENREFISNAGVTFPNSLTVPDSAHYLRFAIATGFLEEMQLEKGTISTPYESYYEQLKNVRVSESEFDPMLSNKIKDITETVQTISDKYAPGKNLFNKNTAVVGKSIAANGLVDNANYSTSDYIRAFPLTEYKASSTVTVAFYNKDKVFLSIQSVISTSFFETPTETHFLRVAFLTPNTNTLQVEYGRVTTPYEPYQDPADIRHGQTASRLKGKKILFLGDSNTHINTFPQKIAERTGAITYNGGFGATRLLDQVSQDSSYLYNHINGCTIADAIATGDFTYLENYAAQIDATIQNSNPDYLEQLQNIKDAYADIANLNAIVITYGTNDVNTLQSVLGETDEVNRFTWGGAINYVIKTISEVHPHIRIYFTSPVFRLNMPNSKDSEGNWKNSDEFSIGTMTLPLMTEKMRDVTKQNHVPFLDLYNDSGINKYTAKHYLKDPVVDGTHYSLAGEALIANIIEGYLTSKL